MRTIRDIAKGYDYYSTAITDRTKKIEEFCKAAENPEHSDLGGLWTFIQSYYTELADLMYSRGDDAACIKPVVEDILKAQGKKMFYYRRDRVSLQDVMKKEKTDDYPEFIKAYASPAIFQQYHNILSILSRAILFGVDYRMIHDYAVDAIKPGADLLLDFIVNSIEPGWQIKGKSNYGKKIDELYKAALENDAAICRNYIESYSSEWLKRLRGHPLYGPHMFNDLNYTGYWNFEAAALCKLRNIDLMDFQKARYFPFSF